MRDSLQQIGLWHGTDKATGHSYLPHYEELFGHLRDEPINLLEIGVENGCSMRMWLEYFTQARIFGVDAAGAIFPADLLMEPRVEMFAQNAHERGVGNLFPPESLDIIVDDGSHVPSQQHSAYHWLWPALKPGGLYLIEDLADVRELTAWSLQPGFRVIANQREMSTGNFRADDILVILRKPE